MLQQISLVGDESESLHSEAECDRVDERLGEPQADPETRRLELQLRQAETQVRLAELGAARNNGSSASIFDLGKATRLIPTFHEGYVDTFFNSFERLVIRLSWPRDQWTLLLQQSFKGKALKAYMALSDSDVCSYEVKRQVLQAYSLVPEAYRQKFRALRKTSEQSHLELARAKREAFVSWCRSKNAESYDQLVELVLIEAFIQVVDRDVASHLAQKNITTAEEAVTIADNYALPKKDSYMSGSRPGGGGSSFPQLKGKGAHQRPLDPLPQGKGISKPAPTGRQREIFHC